MRLLDTESGQFHTVDSHFDVPYVILSHTWDPEGEQSFQDNILATKSILSDPRLAAKIRRSCMIAREAGYRYVWIDSCCIDKTSSSELSEAINSMFVWYRHSSLCFAFLGYVCEEEDPNAEGSEFRRSRWFTRGWTLQELLAPLVVLFLNKEWKLIGTKGTLAGTISQVTRIPGEVLRHLKDMRASSVAQRMSWAALRVTTREEDEAYCVMGIFGVNMPTLYGEGRYAFVRLQEAILKLELDQSIFAWTRRTNPSHAASELSGPS
ncbi:heterokaryon incompatibility protein-domain-containing protein [Trametes meyenii]|nr:heterokaryon incompatibility protein-domain-containing protein [Trametes meyenii]